MKKLITLMVAGLPATAIAHPGHAELPMTGGHDIAHVVIGATVATALVIAATVVRKVVAHVRED